jgi:hypothetical protein
MTAITGATGSYQFTRIPIGVYTVRFELPGFTTIVREGVRIEIGFSAQINAQLEISTLEETITVTGETPIVDTRSTGARTTFDLETLQSIPSARDPWVMLERVPNITMDRINVGGSQSGQQSGYISRGSSSGNNKWALDGVDITDMSATGASPIYYDFDMLEEMQVTTGGADASQQTGGVGINLVSRSGTNRFKGSGRLYNTNNRFQADNITDDIRAAGAGSGAPIKNINDYGIEVGGPIVTDKLWYWGSYGKQKIGVGVVGFYLNNRTCRPGGKPLDPKVVDTKTLRDCLAEDMTLLNNYNWKLTWAPIQNNKFNFQNTWAEKVRNARDASDRRPLETAYRQIPVPSTYGRFGWETGPSPIWKAGNQHVFSDRFLAEIQYAHVGNNFALTFQDPSQSDIQPTFENTTGVWGRSYAEWNYIRPFDSIDLTATYFLPSVLGGDHSFRTGYRYRTGRAESIGHYGGNAFATFNNGVATEADIYRDGYTNYKLHAGLLHPGHLHAESYHVEPGLALRPPDRRGASFNCAGQPIIPHIMPAIEFPA